MTLAGSAATTELWLIADHIWLTGFTQAVSLSNLVPTEDGTGLLYIQI